MQPTAHGDVPEKIRLLSIIAAILLAIASFGCSSNTAHLSDSQRYELASSALESTIDTSIRLYQAGVIDKDDLTAFRDQAQIVRALLDDFHERLATGQVIPATLIDRLEWSLQVLQEFTDDPRGSNLTGAGPAGSSDGDSGSGGQGDG